DITERKQAEDQIRQLNEELEDRVRERTAELAEVNRELVHRNQENEMFVYSVSHDLRAPLVNLQGFSKEVDLAAQDLLALLAADGLPPAVREHGLALLNGRTAKAVRYIQAAVTRLSNIIDALLRLSRAGRVTYRWQHVNVRALVAGVVDSLKAIADQRGAAVRVADLPPAWGDPTALEQVFANLIGNALNYLDPARPGLVEVGCLDPGAPASAPIYYLKANGRGIAPEYQAKVFQAFQRLHPEAAPGEGMGLAIVQRIVERHRGKVWVESAAGEGSTFYVSLPAAPKGERASGAPTPRKSRAVSLTAKGVSP